MVRFISIGSKCSAAFQLQSHGVRGAAMPFDWLQLTPHGLLACLRDDFARFLTELCPCDTLVARHAAARDAYGFEFVHDFRTERGAQYSEALFLSTPNTVAGDVAAAATLPLDNDDRWEDAGTLAADWEGDVEEVRTKYARRIARFRDAMRGSERVVLLYTGGAHAPIDEAWVLDVLAVLRTAYPTLDVRALLVNTQLGDGWSRGNWRAVQRTFAWGRGVPCGIPDVLDTAHTI
jgi:hypothetical protein